MKSKVVILLVVGLLLGLASAYGQEQWPMFHRDQQRTGCGSGGYTILALPTMHLWTSFNTGFPIHASPIIAGNTIYVGSTGPTGAGTPPKLYAIYAHNGAKKWEFATTDWGTITTAAAATTIGPTGRTIYVFTREAPDVNGDDVFAVIDGGPNNPIPKWSLTLPDDLSSPPNNDCVQASNPVVVDEGGMAVIYVITYEGYLCRIEDHGPGNVVVAWWKSPSDWGHTSQEFNVAGQRPTVAVASNGRIYVGTKGSVVQGRLYAINPTTGNPIWNLPLGSVNEAVLCPSIREDGGQIFIYVGTTDYQLYAAIDNGLNGTLKWPSPYNLFTQHGNMEVPGLNPAITDVEGDGDPDIIFAATSMGMTSHIYRIEDLGNNPAFRWIYPTTGSLLAVLSAPAVAYHYGGTYIAASDGNLYAINSGNGSLVSTFSIGPPGAQFSSPAMGYFGKMLGAPGHIFIGSNEGPTSGRVYAFGPEWVDVSIRDCPWDDGSVPSSAVCENGRICVSPDIWIERPLGTVVPNPAICQTNYLFSRVWNIGTETATSITVEYWWADFGYGWPPSGFHHVAPGPWQQNIPSLAPCNYSEQYVVWHPQTQAGVTMHRCIFVKLTNAADPNGSGWDSNWDNNIGWRNFAVETLKETVPDTFMVTVDFKVGNPDSVDTHDVYSRVFLDDWPSEWRVELTSPDPLVQIEPGEYVFFDMEPWQVNDVTLTIGAPEGTENDSGTVHIEGTIDNNPIGGIGVKVLPPVPCGDVNGDYKINLADAIYLAQYVFGMGPPPVSEWASDVNCDYSIDLADAITIASYCFGMIPELNCCD